MSAESVEGPQPCPFLYVYSQSKGECVHSEVFPLHAYTIFVYLLLPLACGLVNSTGHSMGIFRVLVVMNMLRYESIQATMITQAMVVGSAIPNFFGLLLRRHPALETSLVNYNLVLLLIPWSLFGSTIGSLVGSFIPEIGQDLIIFVVFAYFSWNFYQKFLKARRKEKTFLQQAKGKELDGVEDQLSNKGPHNKEEDNAQSSTARALNQQQLQSKDEKGSAEKGTEQHPNQKAPFNITHQRQLERQTFQEASKNQVKKRELSEITPPLTKVEEKHCQQLQQRPQSLAEPRPDLRFHSQNFEDASQKQQITVNLMSPQEKIEKQEQEGNSESSHHRNSEHESILAYEKTSHIPDVLFSVLVFVLFEFLVFLVQGRLGFIIAFSRCDWKYPLGLALLLLITVVYTFFLKRFLRRKFDLYQKYGIYQQIPLNQNKNFFLIVFAGSIAGFTQGILGVGAGTCMMVILLSTPINTISGTATSGYQILFIGLSGLIQGFINGDVDLESAGFFIGLCAVGGGVVTYLVVRFLINAAPKELKGGSKNEESSQSEELGEQQHKEHHVLKVSKVLILIIGILCVVSVIMVIPSIIVNTLDFGWGYMTKISFKC